MIMNKLLNTEFKRLGKFLKTSKIVESIKIIGWSLIIPFVLIYPIYWLQENTKEMYRDKAELYNYWGYKVEPNYESVNSLEQSNVRLPVKIIKEDYSYIFRRGRKELVPMIELYLIFPSGVKQMINYNAREKLTIYESNGISPPFVSGKFQDILIDKGRENNINIYK